MGLLPLLPGTCMADVAMPPVFHDGMVIQCDQPVAVWGTASAGEKVKVTLAGKMAEASAGQDGRWLAKLPAPPAGGPHQMTVAGNNTISFSDVLSGEVWIFAGQSNVRFPTKALIFHGVQEDLAGANLPQLRFYTHDPKMQWVACTPETAGDFGGSAFYFGRELQRQLGVPVGIIMAAQNGAYIERFIPKSDVEQTDWGRKIIQTKQTPEFIQAREQFQAQRAKRKRAKDLYDMGEIFSVGDPGQYPPQVVAPEIVAANDRDFGDLFTTIITPIMPYTVRGFAWYQGEANVFDRDYAKKMQTLVASWRTNWGKDLPMYFMQIAPFSYSKDHTALPLFWETQYAAARNIPGTAIACSVDLGEPPVNIHPPNKREVGRRLALLAMARTYGKNVADSGPVYKQMKIESGKVEIEFDHVGGGLAASDGRPLAWFRVAGQDKKFVDAQAQIDGDRVVVSSPNVAAPVAVRYAWDDMPGYSGGVEGPTGPLPNLANKDGLPAFPFRTDSW